MPSRGAFQQACLLRGSKTARFVDYARFGRAATPASGFMRIPVLMPNTCGNMTNESDGHEPK